jgi:hypothetical protein
LSRVPAAKHRGRSPEQKNERKTTGWVPPPLPRFFVSVDSKQLRVSVSPLESTLAAPS